MSLIQEALRRREEEMGARKPDAPAAPAVPPPLPPSSGRKRARSRRRRIGWLLAALLMAAVTTIVLYPVTRTAAPDLLRRLAFYPADTLPEEDPAAEVRPPHPPTDAPPAMPPPDPATEEPAREAEPDALAGSPGAEESLPPAMPPDADTTAPEPAPPEPAPRGLADTLTTSVRSVLGRQEKQAPAAGEEEPAWPDIRLSGVLTQPGGRHSALLNEKWVDQGEMIKDIRIMEIHAHGVWLEFQGERRFLSVGRSLP